MANNGRDIDSAPQQGVEETDPGVVFISYSRSDEVYVDELAGFFAKQGLTVWTDKGIEPGTPRWTKAIQVAIDGCAAFTVVMTPAADESRWVGREIRRAQTLDKPILPLLLDGIEFFVINEHQYDDVSDRRMPSPRVVKRLLHLTSTAPLGEPVSVRGSEQDWLDEGRRLGNLGRYEEALAAFDRAIELDPDEANTHTNRGRALRNMGRYEEALTAIDRAIELDPNDQTALRHRDLLREGR
jgi:hypothetical protein